MLARIKIQNLPSIRNSFIDLTMVMAPLMERLHRSCLLNFKIYPQSLKLLNSLKASCLSSIDCCFADFHTYDLY